MRHIALFIQQPGFTADRQGGAHGGEELGSEEDKQERQEGDIERPQHINLSWHGRQ